MSVEKHVEILKVFRIDTKGFLRFWQVLTIIRLKYLLEIYLTTEDFKEVYVLNSLAAFHLFVTLYSMISKEK